MLFGSDTDAAPQPDGGVRVHRHEDLHLARPGVDAAGPARPRHHLAGRAEDGLRVRAARTDAGRDHARRLGHARHARHAVAHHRAARGRRARPDRVVRRIDPGPNPDPIVFASSACSSSSSPRSTPASPGARSTSRSRPPAGAGRRRPARPTARIPTSAGASPTWRSPTTRSRRSSRRSCRDVDDLADHGARWFSLLAGVKHRAVTTAKRVVDDAVLVAGGSSYFSGSELSRLYRDVLAGLFHPSDPESAHSTVATRVAGAARGLTDACSRGRRDQVISPKQDDPGQIVLHSPDRLFWVAGQAARRESALRCEPVGGHHKARCGSPAQEERPIQGTRPGNRLELIESPDRGPARARCRRP